jgi:hypothetical protein
VEEVLTGLWLKMERVSVSLHDSFALFPHVAMPAPIFASANLIIVALLMSLSPFIFLERSWAWRVARVVAVIETLNGIGHISAALIGGAYFPGCFSGLLLLALSIPLWTVPSIRRLPSGTD